MSLNKQIIKDRLKETFNGDTQDRIAEKINLSQSTVSKLLSGVQVPTTDQLFDISSFRHLCSNTLYIYAVKILLEWKLPCGWVSTLVMASMICLILMMFLLYPVQFRKEDNKWRFDRKALKLLPAIFLPLLIFHTSRYKSQF